MSIKIGKKKVVYGGFFLTEESEAVVSEFVNNKLGLLEKVVPNSHVTFVFKPEEFFPDCIMGKTYRLKVVGIGYSENNQGLLIEIPTELNEYYKGSDKPHITVALSEEGKAVDTGSLEFRTIDEPFFVEGMMGYFLGFKKAFKNPTEI